MIPLESDSGFLIHSQWLWDSFYKWTGQPLWPGIEHHDPAGLAKALYQAPLVLVSHGTESIPIFNYANLEAQALWKLSWEGFTMLPSKDSAEPLNQEERQKALKQVERYGHMTGYQGIRITADGLRFRIKNTVIWNVVDDKNQYRGQAAVFKEWDWL